ncbi:MAG TPA: DUF4438 domain-containing protein [Thermomicrobiales bacterium]
MPRMNSDKLVELSVIGEVSSPGVPMMSPWRIGHDGVPRVGASSGGITYNVRVGHPACGWEGDHVEPCVSMRNPDERQSGGLNILATIGNAVRLVTGDAKGGVGIVTGKHGGIEHVMVDFPDDVLNNLTIGDRMQIRAYGVGLKFLDYPDVRVMSLNPQIVEQWGVGERNGKLTVPVAKRVPAGIMGSGLGRDNAYRGDYDITLFDPVMVEQYDLGDIRLGDFVAIEDADATFGRYYRSGSVTIGIIAHADSNIAGHGPGVTCLLSSRSGVIEPVLDRGANIADILHIGTRRA